MALTDLTPATRIEEILAGEEISPATRLEYFLQQIAQGGGGSASLVIDVPYAGTVISTQPEDSLCEIATTADLSAAYGAEGPVYIRYPEIVYNSGSEIYELSSEATHTVLLAYANSDSDILQCQSFMIDAADTIIFLVINIGHIEEE